MKIEKKCKGIDILNMCHYDGQCILNPEFGEEGHGFCYGENNKIGCPLLFLKENDEVTISWTIDEEDLKK